MFREQGGEVSVIKDPVLRKIKKCKCDKKFNYNFNYIYNLSGYTCPFHNVIAGIIVVTSFLFLSSLLLAPLCLSLTISSPYYLFLYLLPFYLLFYFLYKKSFETTIEIIKEEKDE